MSQKLSALVVTFVALALVACGAGSVGAGNTALMNGTTYSLPAVESDLAMTATVPKDTIGEELPTKPGPQATPPGPKATATPWQLLR
jgi:hypothetical protein